MLSDVVIMMSYLAAFNLQWIKRYYWIEKNQCLIMTLSGRLCFANISQYIVAYSL